VGILLRGLEDLGHSVDELNEPLGFATTERVAMLARPWTALPFLGRLLRSWGRLVLRRCKPAGRGGWDAVLVGYMGHFDVLLARVLYPRTRIVLDHLISAAGTARDRDVASGGRVTILGWLDRAALAAADVVVVDTQEHFDDLAPATRAKAVVVPVGAPPEWLAAGARPPVGVPPVRVVFFGLYTPLQGAPVIGSALRLLGREPGVTVSMIGHGQDLDATRRSAGEDAQVVWRRWMDPAELPAEVAGHDVCLGIFGTTPKALKVVPNKVFQGAAAGCAIVTSDTAPQRRALGDCAVYVPPGDPEALADAMRSLVRDRAGLAEMKSRARARAVEKFAPARVADLLIRALR
jgi:glycosyltransferase involved in cell wall biosynthesis